MTFEFGNVVERIEDLPDARAVVVQVDDNQRLVKIAYIEGGAGWWPFNEVNLLAASAGDLEDAAASALLTHALQTSFG